MRAVNLIPTDRRPGAGGTLGRSGGAAYAVVGLAAGIVLLAVLWMSAHHTVADRQAKLQSLTAQASAISAGAGSLQSYSSFVSMADARVAAVKQLAAERFDWAHAFHELGRVLPVGISLTNVTGTIGGTSSTTAAPPPTGATGASGASGAAGAAVQSATPSGDQPTMAVQGCATTQALVAQTVQRLALMDGVQNVDLQSSTAAKSGGGGTAKVCPYGFTIDVTFLPLPPASAVTSAPAPTTSAAATTPSAPTTTGPAAPNAHVGGATGAAGTTGAVGAATTATTTSTTRSAAR